jgi:hypothetical protein
MQSPKRPMTIQIIFDTDNYLYSVIVESADEPVSVYDFISPSEVIEIVAELIDANEMEIMDDSEESEGIPAVVG